MCVCIVEHELAQRDVARRKQLQFLARDGPEKTPKPEMIQQLHIFLSHSLESLRLCPQLNSKQAIAICLSFIAMQLILPTDQPTARKRNENMQARNV